MRAETIITEKYGPLPDAPAPVAAYVPVTQSGRIVWCSGQLPVRNGEKPYVGRLARRFPPRTATPPRSCAP